MYIKKLHYYQKVSCVKTFIKRFFYFLCCKIYFQKIYFTIMNSKLLLCIINTVIKTFAVSIFIKSIYFFKKLKWKINIIINELRKNMKKNYVKLLNEFYKLLD